MFYYVWNLEEKKKLNDAEYVTRKIHAAFWIIAAIIIIFATNIISIVTKSDKMNWYIYINILQWLGDFFILL